MKPTQLRNTEYLHDAIVLEIVVRIDENGNRQLRIRLRCDSECGFDEWDDRVLDVVFHDPVVVICVLFGHMTNAESFDSWNEGASDDMASRIEDLRNAGLDIPRQIVGLVLHSGSTIEVACREIEFVLIMLQLGASTHICFESQQPIG